MELLLLFVFWLFLCGLVAYWAHTKGRFAFGWFVISFMLSPLVGGLIVAILPKAGKAALPRDEAGQLITSETHTRCPDCRELVRRDARKCKHCGTVLAPH